MRHMARAFHNLEKDAFAALVETFKAEEQADFEPSMRAAASTVPNAN